MLETCRFQTVHGSLCDGMGIPPTNLVTAVTDLFDSAIEPITLQ